MTIPQDVLAPAIRASAGHVRLSRSIIVFVGFAYGFLALGLGRFAIAF
ncbi:MAG: hypothetical protein M3P18_16530 [Actinomycetota bacterium]|nr:hypothetical protein [Actinomycetota bacterium]